MEKEKNVKHISKDARKWFLGYLKKYYFKLGFALLLVTFSAALSFVNPKVLGLIVDEVIGDGVNINTEKLPLYVGIMLGCTLSASCIRWIRNFIFETASQDMLFDMREGVYKNLMQKDFAFYNKNRTGDLMSRQTGDMQAIRHCVAYVIYNMYECTLLFFAAVIMIFTVNAKMGALMLIPVPFTIICIILQSRAIKPKFAKIRDRFSSLNAFVQENISGNRVVRAFAKEDYEISKFNKENDGYKEAETDAATVWVKFMPIFEVISASFSVILLVVGGYMVINKTVSLGQFIMVNGYLWMLNNPLHMFGWLVNDYYRFIASVEKIYNTISAKPDIMTPRYPADVKKIKGNIEFKNVSYTIEDEDVLHNVSFRVKAGETIGIIGATGAGKSTIMNLICRFYDATEGEVLVDGVNVKDLNLHTLRDGIGMAMQDVFLFSDTIEGNIAYAKPDCPFEKVKWAAELAEADGFIMEMSDGYDTIVGERGVGLSGGQKQRISLARAILKEPSVIILDDTTSAVDMETESHIQVALNALKNETKFIIAHRISSIIGADQIFVLDGGRIVESGNHEELLAKEGYYYTVFTHQYGDFNNIRSLYAKDKGVK